jgi:DNA-binding MurR/RpiR family transcriptional regulator
MVRENDNDASGTRNGDRAGRKPWMTTLESRLTNAEASLNSSRTRLLRSILENAEDNYFLSSRALAKRYEVDKATIVRTIQALGYQRYADFAADLRAHFVNRLTPYTLMKSAAREKRSVADHVEHSLEMDMHNLNALQSQLDSRQVIQMAKRLHSARRIMVVGVDFAASLSYLLAYALVSLGYDAEAPTGSSGNLHQKVSLMGPKDLLIAFSFGRCLQTTVDAVLHARENKVPTFGITDGDNTPIARFCDTFWVASIANPSFHGSYVAPLAAIDALLVACAHIQPERSLAQLQRKDLDSRARWYTPKRAEDIRPRRTKEDKNGPANENASAS